MTEKVRITQEIVLVKGEGWDVIYSNGQKRKEGTNVDFLKYLDEIGILKILKEQGISIKLRYYNADDVAYTGWPNNIRDLHGLRL